MAFPSSSTIEIHRDGAWQAAATVRAVGPDRCRFEYLPDYVFGHPDPWPVATGLPLGFEPDRFVEGAAGPEADRRPPAFFYDLVPQGKGRRYLLDLLKLADAENLVLPLVLAGAFNPIGGLRLSSALDFFHAQAAANPDPATGQGHALEDILRHSQDFLDHLALHAMLASGTTGVQGVAPKFLLCTDAQGRWFADMALPDELAREHWLVKLPRGRSEAERAVLRNEAAYLRLAAACGIRNHATPELHGEMLFVRRFDREVIDGRVHRLQQESLASVCDLRGFGLPTSQQRLLDGLRSVVDDPLQETIEFIKRDVLNLSLRNTDNHARNTAVQRQVNGRVQLTPLFDFAPMYMDPELIVRSCVWRDANGKRQDRWVDVLGTLDVDDAERSLIAAALRDFAPVVGRLDRMAEECGVEPVVVEQCKATIQAQAEQLHALAGMAPAGGASDAGGPLG